jgi:hypothetical protein
MALVFAFFFVIIVIDIVVVLLTRAIVTHTVLRTENLVIDIETVVSHLLATISTSIHDRSVPPE